ncbi:hypothetical protein ACI77O_13150 [Pseudomonas tritici]|uniref:hypothetical protein n=1 Tax=Pseudomonas tritici TaxID=2745518 RepID=UPI00387AC893
MRKDKIAPEGWVPFIRSLARDHKLKVVIGHGVGAATDGETLWLPALPAELTLDDLVLFKGNAFHEVGHIRRTNLKLFQSFSVKHGSFAQSLLNCVEDVFMEGQESQWKKMAERYLLESTMVLIERNQFRDGSANAAEAIGCFTLAYLTAKRWPSVGRVVDRIEANLRMHLGEHANKVVPALRDLLDAEFPAVNSTEDGCTLTLKIIDLLKSLAEQEQSEPSPSNESGNDEDDAESSSNYDPAESGSDETESDPQGDGKGDRADDSSEPNGSGEGKSKANDSDADPKGDAQGQGEADDSKPEQDGKDGSNGNGESNQSESEPNGEGEGKDGAEKAGSKCGSSASGGDEGGSDAQDESSGSPTTQPKTGKSLQQLVDEMLKENLGDQEVFDKGNAVKELAKGINTGANKTYKDQPKIDGLVIDCTAGAADNDKFADGMRVVEADSDMAKVISGVTGRKANVMGNRLRALLANNEESDECDSRNGRLCERNLHRFAMDDARIFAKAEDVVSETAALTITADLSGSTGVGANGTSIAEQIRIALTLIENVLNQIGTPREILGFAPNTGEVNCMVKSFADNHRVALERIAGMHRVVGGNSTPTGEAVMQAGTRLQCHPAQRKLLFVLTDGRPGNEKHAVDMTNFILRSGIEVIYLVIGDESVCTWLKTSNIKYAHSLTAEGLIPAMVSKMADFLK